MRLRLLVPVLALAGLAVNSAVHSEALFEASGRVGVEGRIFTQESRIPAQHDGLNLSLFAEPELFWEWNDGNDTLTFTPFLRVDQHDEERTHGDIRELLWNHLGEEWELRLGIGEVYWGVTEFQHLVNIINQTDGVEDMDAEDKLGQPMINLSLVRDWGILDLFLLPGFREQTFPGVEGRLRTPLPVATDLSRYESGAGEHHLDGAIRWSHTLGDYDIGLHWFHGTQRDPVLQAGSDSLGNPVLIPYYRQIDQLGLDLQATLGDWLWKLETLYRDSSSEDYWAAQGGFEYTYVGVFESAADLGLLMEYGWEQRGQASAGAFQNDLFFGSRVALNDEASSELLAGVGYDLDYHSYSLLMEASRRLGESWKLSLDARFFFNPDPRDLTSGLARDDHLQLTLERYF